MEGVVLHRVGILGIFFVLNRVTVSHPQWQPYNKIWDMGQVPLPPLRCLRGYLSPHIQHIPVELLLNKLTLTFYTFHNCTCYLLKLSKILVSKGLQTS